MPKKRERQYKQPTTLAGFFRSREKAPHKFVFTAEGDAYCPPYQTQKENLPERIFEIPKYRPVNTEEFEELEEKRKEEIANQIKVVEDARDILRKSLDEFRAGQITDKSVVSANLRVAKEESKLSNLVSPQRWIHVEENPVIRQYLLSNRYEKRRFNWRVYEYKQSPYLFQDLVKEITPAEQAALDAEAQGMFGGGVGAYKIIDDQSILGLHWPMDIVNGKISFFTNYAAILGEAANANGIPILRAEKDVEPGEKPGIQLLGTRSIRTLRDLEKKLIDLIQKQEGEGIKVEMKEIFPLHLLQEIIETTAAQNIDFEEALMKTGDEYLVYANSNDTYFSTGLEAENPYLQNSRRWRGQNMWGQALMAARTHIRELAAEGKRPLSSETKVERATITQEEQEIAKKAAIINARRKVNFQMSG